MTAEREMKQKKSVRSCKLTANILAEKVMRIILWKKLENQQKLYLN
jgi:hypothetical protein